MNCAITPESFKSTSDSSTMSEETSFVDLFPDNPNFSYVKKLSDAKFPVYLVSYNRTGHYYAMKIFPWEDEAPTPFFTNEVRFSQFQHPNIVNIVHYDFEQDTSSAAKATKISYLLMEYAKYGDFFDVIISYKIPFNEMLVRTYFHQLIEGVETLHSQGAAHLDLKLENLLMDENYCLKIADFDLSYIYGDGKVKTRGTKNFRAPEMYNGTCTNPKAADVYSAGIILFLFKTEGLVPYKEDDNENEGEPKSLDMDVMMKTDPKKFWEKHAEFLGKKVSFFSEDFKSLFMRMTKPRPEERPTIAQIKSSRWYNKEVYSEEGLHAYMSEKFARAWGLLKGSKLSKNI